MHVIKKTWAPAFIQDMVACPPPPPPPSPFHLQYMVTYLSWQNSLVIFYNKTGLDTRTMSMSLQSCLYKFGMISDDTVWYVVTLWWVSCVLLTSAGGVWVHLFLSTVKKKNSIVHPPLSIRAYEIERRVKTPEKYLFPCYETVNWYAAKHILDILKGEKQYVRLFAELVLMPSW